VLVALLALAASAVAVVVVFHRTGNRLGGFAQKPFKEGFDNGYKHGDLLGSCSLSKLDAMAKTTGNAHKYKALAGKVKPYRQKRQYLPTFL